MSTVKVDRILECVGLACPMPVVRTKKTMDEMETGGVLEVRATDQGSVADLKGWAKRIGHQYIGLKEEAGLFRHFIRKVDATETNMDTKFPHTAFNEELQIRQEAGKKPNILDVREPAEFAFGRIPGAVSIPLGELERRMTELDLNGEYWVVCRTGNRSDMACQMLAKKGFKVINVIPGMSEWNGPLEEDDL
ncbi:sulfurtransferase TusA family protein [Paenibacillus chartarius]|uniref:Sulfurtransferase TusA family protein n=1 Tax=Paenibacillus chartarius TaxID=747481 RepID=A0ABV6DPA1_9BACL